ncbi:Gfo/Idh/MocA family oxidoreductase [Vallitaleaceae bacterium 9-2]
MKKVITYGSFDLFHEGHYNLLKRAKELGDYLIVGITTEYYDMQRGKMNVIDSLLDRIENVKNSGFADEIIIEDHDGQKLEDIIKYKIDIFTVGSDWIGTFDFLREYCEVIYLERTKYVSSTMLRDSRFPIIKLGMIGTGRIAKRFPDELKYVSGINLNAVYNPNLNSAKAYKKMFELDLATDQLEEFYENVDAVNIASPHETHYTYILDALNHGKHVLCEKPLCLSSQQAINAYALAKEKNLVLMEGIKTAYAPGFVQLIGVARSGIIGNIRDVEACFTKLVPTDCRELTDQKYGGSFTELASYTLLPIIKLMGCNYENVHFESLKSENGLDIYTKAYFYYKNALATSKTGLGIKSEGQLLISGTKGYILVKSPWWLTKGFEICFEDTSQNEYIKTKFLGDGLRYEISDLVKRINGRSKHIKDRLTQEESIAMATLMEKFLEHRSLEDIE